MNDLWCFSQWGFLSWVFDLKVKGSIGQTQNCQRPMSPNPLPQLNTEFLFFLITLSSCLHLSSNNYRRPFTSVILNLLVNLVTNEIHICKEWACSLNYERPPTSIVSQLLASWLWLPGLLISFFKAFIKHIYKLHWQKPTTPESLNYHRSST